MLYFVQGLITVLEMLIKGYLIVIFIPGTTLTPWTDWLNFLGPSILPLFVIVMDTTKVWLLIVRRDDSGENIEFLHFMKVGERMRY